MPPPAHWIKRPWLGAGTGILMNTVRRPFIHSTCQEQWKSFMLVSMFTEIPVTVHWLSFTHLPSYTPMANWIFKRFVFDRFPRTHNWLWFYFSHCLFLSFSFPLSHQQTKWSKNLKRKKTKQKKEKKRVVSIATLAMICAKDKWQVFKGLPGVSMFSLCFLLSTELSRETAGKTAMKGKLQRQTEGEGTIATRPWWSMHVLLSVRVLCPQGRRQRRGGEWCTWTVFRALTPNPWPQEGSI